MSKTLEQQIKIMQHFANGGSIEIYKDDKWTDITNSDFKNWNFATFDFRIKKQKETITIEKWIVEVSKDDYKIAEGTITYINSVFPNDKIKLLDTYEVKL